MLALNENTQHYIKMKNKLIGLCGYKGSGKSLVASLLADNEGIISFATQMREMLEPLLDRGELFEKGKEAPLGCLGGKSYRYALQTLGTQWGRECMGDDFWVISSMLEAEIELRMGDVVFDDVRFDNEAIAIRKAGGIVVRLERDSIFAEGDKHASERGISEEYIDAVVDNTGKIEDTVKTILSL